MVVVCVCVCVCMEGSRKNNNFYIVYVFQLMTPGALYSCVSLYKCICVNY